MSQQDSWNKLSLNRRELLKVVAGAPALMAAESSRPNVLLILVDEWRAQATGYAGDANVRTPAIDRLAAQSVDFSRACSNHPVCCPYRGSLITGQYPLTHGLFVNDEELKPNGTTLGQAFANAGYHTGWIGKWHMYGSPQGRYERRSAYIPPTHRFGFQYWKAAECTHEYNRSIYYEGNDPKAKHWPGYDAFAQTDDVRRFIQQQSRQRDPFFLTLSMGPPHFPLNTAPESYQSLFRDREIQFRPNVPQDRREQAAKDLRGYYSHIAAVDDCIGRVLETLDTSGVAGNTIVIFTSDHGDMLHSQGLRSNTKHVPWDESIRVPFLLRYPNRLGPKGRRLKTLFGTPDIMPTLLGLAEVKIPGGVQGADYSKLLAGGRAPKDSDIVLQFPVAYGELRAQGFSEYRGLRTEQYTYVRSIKGPWLLYDNDADPYQMRNLVDTREHRDLQSRLDRTLDAKLKALKDDFLPGQEYIRRFGYEHNREIGPVTRY